MAGALLGRAPTLVVDLRGRDVPMPEKLLDLPDVDAGVEEQGRGRGADRVRVVDTVADGGTVRVFERLAWVLGVGPVAHGAGELLEVRKEQFVHGRGREGPVGELLRARASSRPEERAGGEAGGVEVLATLPPVV